MASGAVAATLLGLLLWVVLEFAGVERPVDFSILASVLAGCLIAGATAGRLAPTAGRFHGSVAGLLLAFVISFTALRGGSPARIWQVLTFFGVAVVSGGLGGSMGFRRRRVTFERARRAAAVEEIEESPDSTGQDAG